MERIKLNLDNIKYIFEYDKEKKILFYTAKDSKNRVILPVIQGEQIRKNNCIYYKFNNVKRFDINFNCFDDSEIVINNKEIDFYDFTVDTFFVEEKNFYKKIDFIPVKEIKLINDKKMLTVEDYFLEFEVKFINNEKKRFICKIEIEEEEVINGYLIYSIHQPFLLHDMIFNRKVIKIDNNIFKNIIIDNNIKVEYGYIKYILRDFYIYEQ